MLPRGEPDDSGLLSERSLINVALAIAVGGLAGLTGGLSAGINLVHRIGPGWALVAGLLAGFAACAVTGLVTARALHDLVTKRLPGPAGLPRRKALDPRTRIQGLRSNFSAAVPACESCIACPSEYFGSISMRIFRAN
jgi:hypothetical protein